MNVDNTFKIQSKKEIGAHSSQAGKSEFVSHQDLVKKGACIRCRGRNH